MAGLHNDGTEAACLTKKVIVGVSTKWQAGMPLVPTISFECLDVPPDVRSDGNPFYEPGYGSNNPFCV